MITDFSLACVAWLKAPLGAPELPEREVLAVCYAAMEPSPALWGKYLDAIEKLEKDGSALPIDHEYLRYDTVARRELMNLTLGSEAEFTNETIRQVAERVRDDLDKEHRANMAVVRFRHEVMVAAERTKSEELRLERDQLSVAFQEAQAKMYWMAERFGRLCSAIIFALGSVTLVGLTFAATVFTIVKITSVWWLPWITGISTAALAGWRTYAGIFGVNVTQLSLGCAKRIEDRAFRLLRSFISAGPSHLITAEVNQVAR